MAADSIDLDHAPLGEMAATRLVDAVAQGDDRLERFYLELKGPLDLRSKPVIAKIAKFILGAANRLPDVAARAFEGYGVMVIGVTDGQIVGMPPIEMMELARGVEPYIGPLGQGPRWDLVRVPVRDSTNEVLIILVDPPSAGQDPFLCRANGDGLIDGRVYVRADGETREATANELDLLMQRGRSSVASPVNFAVRILGSARAIVADQSQTLDQHIEGVRSRLLAALPEPESEWSYPTSAVSAMALSALSSAAYAGVTTPEDRTEERYREQVAQWEESFRTAWPKALERLSGYVFEAPKIEVANGATTFFHDVQVKIHLDGDVTGARYYGWRDEIPTTYDLRLPDPPRTWGPRLNPAYGWNAGFSIPATPYVGPPSRLDWNNSGSIDVTLDVGELRPTEVATFDEQEFVLVVGDQGLTSVRGTWKITARDHNEVFSGELEIAVDDSANLTPVLREILDLE